MQTKDFAMSVKDVSEQGTFEGYASTFGGPPDSYGDIIAPGAFANSLARHKREGTMPRLLFSHKSDELPIGSWTDMAEDGRGLWGQGHLDMESAMGAGVYRALKRSDIRGLSIGYEVLDSERDDKKPGVRMLTELDLFEVSVVNFPANRRSLVMDVKASVKEFRDRLAAGDRLTVREWERLFKEQYGLSNSEAERAVRVHFKSGRGEPDSGTAFLKALAGHH